jgi:hypothetical protein
VITPGSNVDVVEVAEGDVTRMEGLLTASTASAQSVAAAAENTTVRIVECIFANLLSVPTPHRAAG